MQAKIERTVGFCVDDEKVRGVKNGSNVTPVDVSGLDRGQRDTDWDKQICYLYRY